MIKMIFDNWTILISEKSRFKGIIAPLVAARDQSIFDKPWKPVTIK